MKLITPIAWFGGAVSLFLLALASDTVEIVIPSMFAAGVGVGTLFPALKERWQTRGAALTEEPRIRQLEERLRLTEEELGSAVRELARLTELRNFDVNLQLAKSERENPPVAR